ncbi:T6SS phospholipase effector Tle1-like catalytic domain-containing protein [Methylobacterium radiotolerans]|uniref:T6SS phospholipase effector Tle1-like catalytic domain-containing protein n=1 Tax=Methylobacterium radiotolerans TaxID=31998 RepID=UPI0015F58990|nr:DUF2235 domain-containing protein [Methylobacterium radiotolerans]
MARRGGYRHLIFLIDGTWLWPGSDSTLNVYSNVYHLNNLIEEKGKDGQAQIVFYARGLGGVDGLRRYTAGGFSYGIDELVSDLYLNLCSNYEKGDKIYIFGFSRGAIVARALSGMISKGILDAQYINRLESVWRAYAGDNEVILPGAPPEVKIDTSGESNSYLEFCSEPRPKIEFVGIFDSVSGGHGITEIAQRLRIRERKVNSSVQNAVQILAIDEARKFFKPICWTGLKSSDDPNDSRHFEQIWMPGVHSDIGGAYQNRFIGNVSLLTMIDRIDHKTKLGIDLDRARSEYNIPLVPGSYVHIHNEYTKLWRIFSPIRKSRDLDLDIDQNIHPLAELLKGKSIRYKNYVEQHFYKLPPGFESLKPCVEFHTTHFKGVKELVG